MAATRQLSHVYPLGSRLNERGRLEVGGCDAIELAREFGTPAYVVAEADLRARARAFVEAARAAHDGPTEVLFASKAFPCTAVARVLAEEGLGCDVASAGELHLALHGDFDPASVYLHGNAKGDDELAMALERGVGHIVIDGLDEIERVERAAAAQGVRQPVLLRVAPGIQPDTHAAISTGQSDTKFGLTPEQAEQAIERVGASDHLELEGLHAHIGSQIFDLDSFQAAIAALAPLGDFDTYDVGGGLAVAYTGADAPPSIESYVEAVSVAVREQLGAGKRLVLEPGRALTANSTVTLYSVVSVKRTASTYVAVDGGMSDNLRPMLYGAVYEAQIADRFGGGTLCHVAGKHCESGDIIVRDVELDHPHAGDVLVTPATGAYGHAMANNYNGVPRPPVIFCNDGEARVVVRRETLEDLTSRDA
jgi:diaminopimelate decarboxylase